MFLWQFHNSFCCVSWCIVLLGVTAPGRLFETKCQTASMRMTRSSIRQHLLTSSSPLKQPATLLPTLTPTIQIIKTIQQIFGWEMEDRPKSGSPWRSQPTMILCFFGSMVSMLSWFIYRRSNDAALLWEMLPSTGQIKCCQWSSSQQGDTWIVVYICLKEHLETQLHIQTKFSNFSDASNVFLVI